MNMSIKIYTLLIFITSAQSFNNPKVHKQQGIFESLRGYMGELGSVMNDVASGIQKLGKGIRQVEEFLDATVDEECIFECPDGGQLRPNPDHTPTSNGCGSLGLEDFLTADVLPLEEFVECCDDHDICYGTCGNDKDTCDLYFKKCLYKKCRAEQDSVSKFKHKGCQAGAKVLHAATTTLGCKSFINAQKENCLCPNHNQKGESKSKTTRDEF